ncbi:MAG: signal peptidase I [Lachnospiraceae bacterium]|nr:signal peptidase I [Lachnospiraceae bacterium]
MARHKGLSFYRRRKKISSNMIKEIASWIFGICIAVLFAFVVVFSVGMKTSVIGVSMEPALYNGQKILINRFIYRLSSPKKGDVVVFLPNGNQNAHYYVKRVAAVPGDTVQIKEGRLYINGIVEEEEQFDKMADAGIAENEIRLAEDEYFVLGDNRNNSEDSRSGNIGPIQKDTIAGKAWFHMGAGEQGIGFVE